MFSHRLDFSRRFQKSTPKMANLAFVRKANLVYPRYKRETEGGKSFGVTRARLWNMQYPSRYHDQRLFLFF
jgi:hypothetical protein